MKEFVCGTDKQFAVLKEMLQDHRCHVFRCKLPDCCSKSHCRIGFEKEGDTFVILIDKGITCKGKVKNNSFKEWLSIGTLRFLDFTDLKVFFKNLNSLY